MVQVFDDVAEVQLAERRLRRLGMVSIPLMALGSEEDGRNGCDNLHESDVTLAVDDQE